MSSSGFRLIGAGGKTMRTLSLAAIAAAMASSGAFAGELPAPVDELKYPSIVKPTHEFKSWGLGPQNLNNPYTCRHTADGGLLISDFENGRLKRYDFATRSLTEIGLRGADGPLGPIAPFAALQAADGHLFVVDRVSRRLLEFSPDGVLLRRFGADAPGEALLEGGKLAISGSRIAVTDTGNNRVLVYDRAGPLLGEVGRWGRGPGEFDAPESAAFDATGHLYVLDSYNNRIQVFDQAFKLVRTWGQWGSFRGLLANPSDIAIAPDGDVYVTDLLNHRVQVFRQDGTFRFQFGRHPPESHEGAGRLHYPTSISVSPTDGSLATCEPFESRIQRFDFRAVAKVKQVNDSAWWDKGARFHYGARPEIFAGMMAISEPDTHAVLVFHLDNHTPRLVQIIGGQGSDPGQFIRPSGLSLNGDRLLVSDAGNRRIQEFVIDPRRVRATMEGPPPSVSTPAPATAQRNFSATVSGVPSATDAVSFVASHAVRGEGEGPPRPATLNFSAAAAATPVIEPSALRRGPDGLLYVADPYGARILALDAEYRPVRAIQGHTPETRLNLPLDFSFSKDGRSVFVVDHYNYRVLKFGLDGAYLGQIGGPGSEPGRFVLPFGVISGKDGFVYVSDVGAQRVQKFTEEGVFVTQWGRWGTGPGEFYKPKGIAQMDDGTLVVIDFGNHRAQMFKPSGEFIRTFGIENAVVTVARP